VFLVCGTWGRGIKEGGGVGDLLGVWKREWKNKNVLCV
jgi:hypothetical protein